MELYKETFWTSDLEILTISKLPETIKIKIKKELNRLEDEYSNFKNTKFTIERFYNKELKPFTRLTLPEVITFSRYNTKSEKPDVTGLMKGLAIQRIKDIILMDNQVSSEFAISFGKDILVHGFPINLKEFNVSFPCGCVFTSENGTKRRGNHVHTKYKHKIKRVTVISPFAVYTIDADYWATRILANPCLAFSDSVPSCYRVLLYKKSLFGKYKLVTSQKEI